LGGDQIRALATRLVYPHRARSGRAVVRETKEREIGSGEISGRPMLLRTQGG